MRLKDKVGIVTGAGSGIGRASAKLFCEEGANVGVVDIDRHGGDETVESIKKGGGQAVFIKADVSKADDVKRAIDVTVKKFGDLHFLLNNAGINGPAVPVDEVDEEDWNRVIDINLKGVFLLSKYGIQEIVKHGHGGAIVNVASNMGIAAVRNLSPYCASKGGVILLTKAMALDCGKYGIRVNCICPGTILTPMTLGFFEASGDVEEMKKKYRKAIPLKKFGTPKDIAYSALYLISDESSFATGSALVIDGGRTAAAPGY